MKRFSWVSAPAVTRRPVQAEGIRRGHERERGVAVLAVGAQHVEADQRAERRIVCRHKGSTYHEHPIRGVDLNATYRDRGNLLAVDDLSRLRPGNRLDGDFQPLGFSAEAKHRPCCISPKLDTPFSADGAAVKARIAFRDEGLKTKAPEQLNNVARETMRRDFNETTTISWVPNPACSTAAYG